jgi:ABC-type transport system involved in cytochrome bd biosynthesis fused ATPase/permease subunit
VIAHRRPTIRDGDNVIVINDGEIVEQGTHQQLLAAKGFFHHLYMSQFKGLAIQGSRGGKDLNQKNAQKSQAFGAL